jgi:hypothetical protein
MAGLMNIALMGVTEDMVPGMAMVMVMDKLLSERINSQDMQDLV